MGKCTAKIKIEKIGFPTTVKKYFLKTIPSYQRTTSCQECVCSLFWYRLLFCMIFESSHKNPYFLHFKGYLSGSVGHNLNWIEITDNIFSTYLFLLSNGIFFQNMDRCDFWIKANHANSFKAKVDYKISASRVSPH